MKNFEDLFVQTSWRIMESLHDASSTAEGLNACLEALCDALDSPQGSIWLTLENGERLYELAEIGGGTSGISLNMGEGVTGRVANDGKCELHVYEEIQHQLAPEERGAGFPEGYLLWVPLCIGKKQTRLPAVRRAGREQLFRGGSEAVRALREHHRPGPDG